ncbi:MAG: hypothetical protein J1G38_07240 [Clostridiales bacterium]|nr:hypothetical protein [Clostridiales bacterium]
MAKKQPIISYEPREKLDGELEQAIGDILSAEDEAKRIIGRAEESVKAIGLDGATRERNMREHAETVAALKKSEAVKNAEKEADAAVADMIEKAHEKGKALVKEKSKAIEKRANELFDELRGK